MGTFEEKVRSLVNQYDNACYIVGGGPSLKGFDWSLLTPNKFVIAINRSYEVLPNAQVIYFTDKDYWHRHKQAMIEHKGQMIRGSLNPEKEPPCSNLIMYKLTGANGLETQAGKLRHGANSTYAAINLATVHFGFTRIYLLGVDMKWGASNSFFWKKKFKKIRLLARPTNSHWHDGHARIDPEAAFERMKKFYQTIVTPLSKLGVIVYNANPDSALEVFPKISLEQALKGEPS